MEKLENETSVELDGKNSGTLYQTTGKTQDNTTCFISSAASLQSSSSSVSCYSDFSVDASSDGRVYIEECSTDSSQEDPCPTMHTGNGNCEEAKSRKFEGDDDGESGSSCSERGQFWLPPEPENDDDDIEGSVANYDDDECGDDLNWGKPTSLISFGEEGSRSFKLKEEKQKALEEVMNGKLKAIVSDLLKSFGVVGIENWVDIVTSLSWEAASFVKPDSAQIKAMDPNTCVKIKCILTGSPSQSQFIRGLVFKKHAAHKHMPAKFDKPRLLLIKGALGLSSSELSSFQSLINDKDRMKPITEMLERYQPNVILVEKAVTRDIQEFILKKGLTVVSDMKEHRLDRVSRCTVSPILSSETESGIKLRQCDSFYFQRFVEEHCTSTDGGKRPSKTLMFVEGCPTRLGCTILLMGGNSEELKKIKGVVRCAVIMAYNLILETSFLLDQKAMFATIPLEVIDEKPCVSAETELVDVPISNGFHEDVSHNVEARHKYPVFGPYSPVVLSGLSSLSAQFHQDQKTTSSDEEKASEKEHQEYLELQISNENMGDDNTSLIETESILVLMSSRNALKGTVCAHSHFSRIKFYQHFDIPLGKFLQDDLLSQKLPCNNCGDFPEAHIFYYAHYAKLLAIQVRSLPKDKGLPGESEGKIWMWSRCGRCEFNTGRSKSTKRVLVSTGSQGFSFGKFLELSFSDTSSFNKFSGCGHCFHRDFVYFFGLGRMVAIFKYSTVTTYSVSLPPLKLEFSNCINGEFLKKDFENVHLKGIKMFLDVEKALKAMESRFVGTTLNLQGSARKFSEVEDMLKEERARFEIDIQNAIMDGNHKLVSLNRIRLELLLESCVWDRRLHSLLSSEPKTINQQEKASVKQDIDKAEANDFPVKDILIDISDSGSKEQDEASTSSTTEENGSGTINKQISVDSADNSIQSQKSRSLSSILSNIENDEGWWTPFPEIRCQYLEHLQRGYPPKIGSITFHALESTAYKLITDEGSRLHIPVGSDKYIVSDYEEEFSSIIACALAVLKDSPIVSEDRGVVTKAYESPQGLTQIFSLASPNLSSTGSLDLAAFHSSNVSEGSALDSSVSFTDAHPEVSMGLVKLTGKYKYSVLCLYARQFRHLRDRWCPSEVDYITSLSRCKSWDAKGGKSKSLFAKTVDDRFIIKEIKRTEFDSFLKFAPSYFEYMEECYEKGNPTCLAKILGIYQVIVRAAKGGKETRSDLMVMENLSFGRTTTRQYDLKGALHSRFSSAGNSAGDVLLDQNFVNDMNISPLYVGTRSKRGLQRAVWNDCGFLKSINVMDYSLLVGVDAQRRELVCGIIDYLRQYTWDKQLENWVKSSLVVPKNQLPTIVSPKEYYKRFRKFIDTHFLSVPDDWCSQKSSNPCKPPSGIASPQPDSDGDSDELEDASSDANSTAEGKQNGSIAS